MGTQYNSPGVDVLIIGSGPVGSTYARILADSLPGIKMLMVDIGPKITRHAGKHVKNITDAVEKEKAQILSQGPVKHAYPVPTMQERAEAANSGLVKASLLARPGTHLVAEDDQQLQESGMPAASFSSNIGGMGAHWTCACPRPGNTEKISFIPEKEWKEMFSKAEKLLSVTQTTYDETVESITIRKVLGNLFNDVLPKNRKVQRMPLACKKDENNGKYWTGTDVILEDLLTENNKHQFKLRSETICRQIIYHLDKVNGAWIEHLPSGKLEKIHAKIIIVAADAIRTPQLLWASGIRPTALGHYLNDQPQIMCAVELDEGLVQKNATPLERKKTGLAAQDINDPTLGVFWVPFHDPIHPFHGQVMHMDLSPIQLDTTKKNLKPNRVVGLGWFCRKELRFEDYLEFDDSESDYLGMPKITIHYELTAKDRKEISLGMKEQAKAAAAFGKMLKEGEQFMIPAGSSLHYQGSVRMGVKNDGQSVCDPYSSVWGFDNLFVGGNGVIPTATACNPTLTSVALAVRACEKIVGMLFKKENKPVDKMKDDKNETSAKPAALDLAKWGGTNYIESLDGVIAAPEYHHIVYENDYLRLLVIFIQPGEEEQIHTHKYKSALWFTDYSPCLYTEYEWDENKNLIPGRSFILPQLIPEKAIELPPEGPHTVKNVGNTLLKLYRMELKN